MRYHHFLVRLLVVSSLIQRPVTIADLKRFECFDMLLDNLHEKIVVQKRLQDL